jgi:Txe/YoeB family toxin of Txe-Axe toxin-antitoxin module
MSERIAQPGNARSSAGTAAPKSLRANAGISALTPCEQRLALLQHAIGNQGVLRRMEAGLRINDINDPAEREADRVADQVMASTSLQKATASISSPGAGAPIQRKCSACEKEDEAPLVHRKESSPSPLGGSATAPAIVDQTLNSVGHPLDPGTRSFMEERFGQDFGKVRIHSDATAAESAEAVNARAYAFGNDIVFGQGEYNPRASGGARLLAHELTHVVQNRGSSQAIRPFISHEKYGQGSPLTGESPQAYITQPAQIQHAPSGVLRRTASAQDLEAQKNTKLEHEKDQRRANEFIDQMAKIKPDPSKGWDDPDNLIYNALQWLPGPGRAKTPVTFVVMAPTHDSTTRDPSMGTAYFDTRVRYPDIGGDYPADPAVKTHPGLMYELAGAQATTLIDEIHLYTNQYFDEESLKRILIHEVQHVADQSRLFTLFGTGQLSLAAYKTEFRAHWIQAEPPKATGSVSVRSGPSMNFGSSQEPATNSPDVTASNPQNCSPSCKAANQSVKTHFKNLRQENIFWYLLYFYKYRGFDCLYVCDPQFRKSVDDMAFPEGVNLANSTRIEDLNNAIEKCRPQMNIDDPAVLHAVSATRKLTNLDRQFLQDASSSAPFWNRVQSHIPQGMVDIISNLSRTGKEIEEHFEDLPTPKANRGLG